MNCISGLEWRVESLVEGCGHSDSEALQTAT